MKEFLKTVLEYLCTFNRLAIIILSGLGADALADKYNFPWQITAFIVVGLLIYDYQLCQKKRKEYLQWRIDKFIEENRSSLDFSQIMEMQKWYE